MTPTIATAKCTGCGAPVKRMLSTIDHNPQWRNYVLCPTCRETDTPTAAVINDMLDTQHRNRWRDIATRFDPAAHYDTATLPTTPTHRWEHIAAEAIQQLLSADPATRCGVMLVGPTGIGKTWAAFAIANHIADLGYAHTIRATSEADLLGAHIPPWQVRDHITQLVDGANVLLIDDIGVAARHHDQIHTGWKLICDVISAQPQSMLLVGTSNRQSWLKAGGLGEWVGGQSVSRLRSWMTITTTGTTDRRTGQTHHNWAAQVGPQHR